MNYSSRVLSALVLVALVATVPSAQAQWIPDGVPLCTVVATNQYPQITSDGAGGAIVTWYDNRDGNWDIYVQRVDASGAVLWTADGVSLGASSVGCSQPHITSDGTGGAIVIWSGLYETWAMCAQRIDASGLALWPAGGVVMAHAATTYRTMTSDAEGGAIVTWLDWFAPNGSTVYAQRVSAAGDVLWATNGVDVGGPGGDKSPQLTSDGTGGAIITWQTFSVPGPHGGNSNILAARVDASGDVLWGASVCTAEENQSLPKATTDGEGGAIITWQDWRSGGYHIYVQRIDSSGSVQWTDNGVNVGGWNTWRPQITSDHAGGAIITWSDQRSGNYDIYAQRVDPSGSMLWTVDGVALCVAGSDQLEPQITYDGAGGAIVTWQDQRSGIDNVYAQRVDPLGNVLWTVGGVALCNAEGNRLGSQATSDGAGGAIITWQDNRYENWDIYAQRVLENGQVGSDVTGVPGETALPLVAAISTVVPNPFNPRTTIWLSLPTTGEVTVAIHDLRGRLVRALWRGSMVAGGHPIVWDGTSDRGHQAAAGVYLVRLVTADGVQRSTKITLTK